MKLLEKIEKKIEAFGESVVVVGVQDRFILEDFENASLYIGYHFA